MPFQQLFQNQFIFVILALWVLPWKGVALWKAARLRDKWWFVAILVLNTAAILDILYIYMISRRRSLRERNIAGT
ncbi:MAG: DUF5652 family protein [bacterium]